LKSFGSAPETYNTSSERRQNKMADIIFAYADIMLKKQRDEDVPLRDNESLQPDSMYDRLTNTVRKSGFNLVVKKTPLNKKILKELLTQPIKILFILCHGEFKVVKQNSKSVESSWFCLEDEDDPFKVDQFDEERLIALLG
jgi:hypothetical protein